MRTKLQEPKVVIVEFGGQLTMRIGTVCREHGVRAVILEPRKVASWIKMHQPDAIILSGGYKSVYDKDAPRIFESIFSLTKNDGSPVAVLSICYGAQYLAQLFGAEVRQGQPEYAGTEIATTRSSLLFLDTPDIQKVWMSHGDSIMTEPTSFTISARSGQGTIAAFENVRRRLYGVQFHPEAAHTPFGAKMISNFLFRIAHCKRDWEGGSIISTIQGDIERSVGKNIALIGASGGVDSTVLTAMAAPVLGPNLHALTIDGRHLRENEIQEIARNVGYTGVEHHHILNDGRFVRSLAGIVDAEAKRAAFRADYVGCITDYRRVVRAKVLLQGTLNPDRIESGATGGDKIKTHHNVGLKIPGMLQLHPLEMLFKYEVRALAKELGLPDFIVNRHPFPGPGLFLRILGTPVTKELLDLVRWADGRVTEILQHHSVPGEGRSWYDKISQLVVAYGSLMTTGQKGDGRTYKGEIIVRAVETLDFMTAKGVYFPEPVWSEIVSTLTKHREINRAWLDSTPKPPGTTEFE